MVVWNTQEETYLVIGACGYLGNNIVRHLVECGKKVRCLILKGEDVTPLKGFDVEIFQGDIREIDSLKEAFTSQSPLYVIHAAGEVTTQVKMDEKLWALNVEGTRAVVEMCQKTHSKLVYIGSVDAITPCQDYSQPIVEPDSFCPDSLVTAYGKSKAAATNIVLEACKQGLCANVIMPTAVFGPYDYKKGMVSTLLSIYSKKVPLPLIKGGYDFVDARDVAGACVWAFNTQSFGQTYVLSNRFVSFLEIVNVIREQLGYKLIKNLLPNFIAFAVGYVVEFWSKMVKKTPLFTPYLVHLANSGKCYDNTKARLELHFTPRSVRCSVQDSVSFMQEVGFLPQSAKKIPKKKIKKTNTLNCEKEKH